MSVTRRDLLRGSAAALAAGTLPSGWAVGAQRPRAVQVAIIGAGLSGLAAARHVVQQGIDSVVVLEARNRVGGRTLNLDLPGGHVVEGGGEWIGPGQDHIAALAKAVGVETFPAYYDGAGLFEIQGHVSKGMVPDFEMREGLEYLRLAWRLQRMAEGLPYGEPWTSADAAAWDRMTLADWLKSENASAWSIECFRIVTRAVMSGYPERISLLWFLFYLRSGGGLLRIAMNDMGLQDLRFVGGSQLVSQKAAQELGVRVRLREPVRTVRASSDGPVTVQTAQATYTADRVIVAMAPADAMRIDFGNSLSPQRVELCKRWAMLTRLPLIKHSVVYESPFWRDQGLNGNVVSDHAPFQLVFDNSPPDASLGVLTCFLSPTEVPQWAHVRTRANGIPRELARYFGPQARETVAYVEKDWATDPWSSGCITPLPPGLLSTWGPALREANGRLYWAGTESAEHGCGYMDGAVVAGERAASEVAAALKSA